MLAAACSGGGPGRVSLPTGSSAATGSPAATGPASTPARLPPPTGPFAGLRWPAGSVPVGVLLHDDGLRLWAVPLRGRPRLLWRHPPARVYEIAAGPDGRELAYSVQLPARTAAAPSFVLYLLGSDGRVRTVDVVRNFLSIDTPVFLRAPTDLTGPVRLYWIRGSHEVSPATGRLENQVMVLGPRGPLRVTVPLRYEEAPFELHGYPGSLMFSLSLFRTNNVPTRLEILLDLDFGRAAQSASLTLWGDLERPVNTDIFTGVAWVTPFEYVIPVAQELHPNDYSLRLFRFDCEQYGSHVVYQGTGIDWGYAEQPWPMLPGGRDRVLVLGAADVRRVAAGKATQAPWLAVDLSTGRVTRTDAVWTPPGDLLGWWTFVQPTLKVESPSTTPSCSDLTWTYP